MVCHQANWPVGFWVLGLCLQSHCRGAGFTAVLAVLCTAQAFTSAASASLTEPSTQHWLWLLICNISILHNRHTNSRSVYADVTPSESFSSSVLSSSDMRCSLERMSSRNWGHFLLSQVYSQQARHSQGSALILQMLRWTTLSPHPSLRY